MKRIGLWIALLLIGAVIGLGFLPWPITGFMEWAFDHLSATSGWHLSIARAHWVPWGSMELVDLKLQTPYGGRLHVTSLWIHPNFSSLLKGSLATDWKVGDIRMDPGSWGIRKPLAQELLSAMPVAAQGSALLEWEPDKWRVKNLTLRGPMLKCEAEGWLDRGRQAEVTLQGSLGRALLVGMNLLKPGSLLQETGDWEPFQLSLKGALDHPEISFVSHFFTISLKSNGEKKA